MTEEQIIERAEAIMARASAQGRDLTEAEAAEIREINSKFWADRAAAVRSRADFERFLREHGFARGAARKLSGAWHDLRPDHARADLLGSIRAATEAMRH